MEDEMLEKELDIKFVEPRGYKAAGGAVDFEYNKANSDDTFCF